VLEIVGHGIVLGRDGANFTCGVLGCDININNNMAVVGKMFSLFMWQRYQQ